MYKLIWPGVGSAILVVMQAIGVAGGMPLWMNMFFVGGTMICCAFAIRNVFEKGGAK